MFKAIVIDDEIDACEYLIYKIKNVAKNIEIVGIAYDLETASILLQQHNPDLAFFDIEMSGQNSIEFLKKQILINTKVVLVTSYSQYAMSALKIQVYDYILKPIDPDELRNCINKFIVEQNKKQTNWHQMICEKYYKFKEGMNEYYIHIKDIVLLEGDRGYSNVHFIYKSSMVCVKSSYPISHYESLLPNHLFLRIHKSSIINKNHILEIKVNKGKFVMLTGGIEVGISKRKEKVFFDNLTL
jgi:two-component system, LytTR family, response regulator